MKILGISLLFLGVSGAAMASAIYTPEIDPGSAGTALALLTGTLLVIRASRKK